MTTATAARPQPASAGPSRGPSTGVPSPGTDRLAARRTLLALLASALAVVPLKQLFSDVGWLVDVWIAMAVVMVPATLLRLRRPASALDIWPGIVLLVPYLTARYVGQHAWAGLIPNGATWHDLARLMTQLHHTTRDEAAPVHTTVAIRLVLCALLGLLAALIDLIAVVGRRGALAGVPLLVVYTVAGAVPREPVSWLWFVIAAVGFLILLAVDSGNDLDTWGRRIQGHARRGPRRAMSVATQRIAVAAVVIAVLLPLLVPGQPRNLIADAFHGSGSGFGGFGGGNGGSISPFAELKGQLVESQPVDIAHVRMLESSPRVTPFYLKVNVLSEYTDDGWQAGPHGSTEPVGSTNFASDPPQDSRESVEMTAQIAIDDLVGNAPVFSDPRALSGVGTGTTWSPQDQLLLGETVHSGQTITEQFAQPDPSVATLRNATDRVAADLTPYTQVPSDFPQYVVYLVRQITAGSTTPYDRAVALQNFFTNPANGFVYSLKSSVGDSGSELVDFLRGRQGFCQQYAAAMAIMLRVADIPSRVVLGYMHPDPDSRNQSFVVTSRDAHAWVEAYFTGIGWIPFDPTPAAGLTIGKDSNLPWQNPRSADKGGGGPIAPTNHPTFGNTGSTAPDQNGSSSSHRTQEQPGGEANSPTSGGGGVSVATVLVTVGILAVVALCLVPALVRIGRRRRRLLAGRRDGDADALWAELSDTAVDLGYAWSPARSPRQVAEWLSRTARNSADSLRALAAAVEQRRFAFGTVLDAGQAGILTDQLRDVTSELRSRRSLTLRVSSLLWPASLRATGRARRR